MKLRIYLTFTDGSPFVTLHSMAHPNDLSLDELSAQLSQLSTKDAKMEAVSTYVNSALQGPGQRETIVHLAGNNVSNSVGQTERRDGDTAILMRLLEQHGLDFDDYMKILSESEFDASLARAPCAHVVPEEAWSCPNEGRMICSNCNIVAYCSKVNALFFVDVEHSTFR